MERLTHEWIAIIRQYRSHPAIVTWVPFNESWGIPNGAHIPAERAFSLALTHLTRALDPSRPVDSNDGWEHTDSDISTVHDYDGSGEVLRQRYGSASSVVGLIEGVGPTGHLIRTTQGVDHGQPVMLTEFGGVSYATGTDYEDSWGYSSVSDVNEFRTRFTDIMRGVLDSPVLSGFCYTQLTDTRQETNGLCDENRIPKLPAADIRATVRGVQ